MIYLESMWLVLALEERDSRLLRCDFSPAEEPRA